MVSTKNFELIWKEYIEFCKQGCEMTPEIESDVMAGLNDCKNDFMHFYDFLRFREEI